VSENLVHVEVHGLEELESLMKKKPKEVDRGLRATTAGVLSFLLDKLKQYPPRRLGARTTFKTNKQRRFFFWAIKQTPPVIEVPYRRGQSPGSQKLGMSWSYGVEGRGKEIKGILKNPVKYGPLVQGAEQTPMHKATGWPTIYQVVESSREEIREFFSKMLASIIRGAGGG